MTVETRHVASQTVACLSGRVLASDLPAFIDRSMEKIHSALARAGAEPGVPFVAYHGEVSETADGPVEVCVPFERHGEVDALQVRSEPAHQEAFVRLTKRQVAYPEILEAYATVEVWLSTHGHPMTGSPREVYFADWDAAADDDLVCDVAFPF